MGRPLTPPPPPTHHTPARMTTCDRAAQTFATASQALGYEVVDQTDDIVDIAPGSQSFPGIEFIRTERHERRKSPLHLDLNPDDQDAEVARLIALGARRVDVGQGPDASWVVLADPEDNAFCVLARQAGWTHPA